MTEVSCGLCLAKQVVSTVFGKFDCPSEIGDNVHCSLYIDRYI